MRRKHKFILVDESIRNHAGIELATCSDLMTANFLADHYRSVYKGNDMKLSVVHKLERKEKIIVDGNSQENKEIIQEGK